MLRRLLKSWLGEKPFQIPSLYPELSTAELESYLTDQEYRRVKAFRNVFIVPLASRADEPLQQAFGFGLQRVLIRNLMLLRDVSIHGPEDTPELHYEEVPGAIPNDEPSCNIYGVARFGPDGFRLAVEFDNLDREVVSEVVVATDFAEFLFACSKTIARLLGSRVDDSIAAAWRVGQPRDVTSLTQLGGLLLRYKRKSDERVAAAKELLALDPDFVTPMWEINEALSDARRAALVDAFRRDPYNAQLCWEIFTARGDVSGPRPDYLQFCRKALEISPGHAKAHMAFPLCAERRVNHLRHAELGYLLLPGNTFAIMYYFSLLREVGASDELLIELLEESIEAERYNPNSFFQLIEIYSRTGRHDRALAAAEHVQTMLEPLHEHALHCLRQDPTIAERLYEGTYDPAAENLRTIRAIRARISGNDEAVPGSDMFAGGLAEIIKNPTRAASPPR